MSCLRKGGLFIYNCLQGKHTFNSKILSKKFLEIEDSLHRPKGNAEIVSYIKLI